MGTNYYNHRRYPCGCHHVETEVLDRLPSPPGGGGRPAILIRHRTWGDHNPNRVHQDQERAEVRARDTDRWPARA